MSELDAELTAELTEIFREEATTRLDRMDEALLAMESGNAGAQAIDSLFRNAHTIKGSAGMLGFDDVRSLSHSVEDILASVREAGVFPPELAEPLLRATAALRAHVIGSEEPIDGLIDELAAIGATPPNGDARTPGASAPEPSVAGPGGPEPGGPEPGGPEPGGPEPGGPEPGGPEPGGPEPGGPEPGGPEPPEPSLPEPSAPEPSLAEPSAPEPSAPEPSPPEPSPPEPSRAGPSPTGPSPTGPSRAGPSGPERRTLRVPAEKIDHLLDVVGEIMQHRRRLTHSLADEAPLSQDIAERAQCRRSHARRAQGHRRSDCGRSRSPRSPGRFRARSGISRTPRARGRLRRHGRRHRTRPGHPGEPVRAARAPAAQRRHHGIEPPARAGAGGQAARGRVELRAVPRGSLVEIVVADDGRGVSPEVIEEARREGSLVDVLARAGYSTAERGDRPRRPRRRPRRRQDIRAVPRAAALRYAASPARGWRSSCCFRSRLRCSRCCSSNAAGPSTACRWPRWKRS